MNQTMCCICMESFLNIEPKLEEHIKSQVAQQATEKQKRQNLTSQQIGELRFQ